MSCIVCVNFKKSDRLIIPGLAVVFFTVMLLCGCGSEDLASPEFFPHLKQTIHAQGVIRAQSSDSFFSPIKGEAAKVLELIAEGIIVDKDDVICRIDDYKVRTEIDNQELELEKLYDEKNAHQVKLKLDRELSYREEANRRAELKASEAAAATYGEIEVPLKKMELENALRTTQDDVENKKQTVMDVREFLEKGYAAAVELERAERALENSRYQRAEKQQRLKYFLEVEEKKEQAARDENVRILRERISGLLSSREADGEVSEGRIGTLEARIAKVKTEIVELRSQLKGCEIRAVNPGIVVYGTVYDKQTGDRPVRVGDLVWSNVVLVQVTNLSRVDIVLNIPEEQMHDLKEDLQAEIWMTAEPLSTLDGQVRSIGSMASEKHAMEYQRSVTIRVEIVNPPEWIRPGMTGKTRITVKEFEDSLVVPYASVLFEENQAFMFLDTLWGLKKTPVEIRGSVDQGIVTGEGITSHSKFLREAVSR